ncbi:MAG: hypothetical protein E6G14_16480, partial [Actinobacteria bacterium]
VVEAELDRYENGVRQYIASEIDEDAFRVFRLNQGIYGQRQGGHDQMVRVKVPYGRLEPDQLEMLGYVAEAYSRGWAHLTTRQNVQFHFVQLEQTAEVLRLLAAVGLTSREACGDTVRNVAGCHLAGACPYEVLDISPWAEAAKDHFLRNPLSQRLPRKFKINFSGCATDCGQAAARRHRRTGLPGVLRRRARREPAPRAGARGVHAPRPVARHARGDPARAEQPRQPRQQAPGAHEVARRHDGCRRAARAHLQGAQVLDRLGDVPSRGTACRRRARRRARGRGH